MLLLENDQRDSIAFIFRRWLWFRWVAIRFDVFLCLSVFWFSFDDGINYRQRHRWQAVIRTTVGSVNWDEMTCCARHISHIRQNAGDFSPNRNSSPEKNELFTSSRFHDNISEWIGLKLFRLRADKWFHIFEFEAFMKCVANRRSTTKKLSWIDGRVHRCRWSGQLLQMDRDLRSFASGSIFQSGNLQINDIVRQTKRSIDQSEILNLCDKSSPQACECDQSGDRTDAQSLSGCDQFNAVQ